MTNEVTISIEEYAKLISEKNSFEIGFTITISILCCITAAILVTTLFNLFIKEKVE